MADPVRGQVLDNETRCAHWHGHEDVVAFRFPCCDGWWPCRRCHDEAVDHATEVWGPDAGTVEAVLCGVCRTAMTIRAYVGSGHRCPSCTAPFNPGCRAHWPVYFEVRGP